MQILHPAILESRGSEYVAIFEGLTTAIIDDEPYVPWFVEFTAPTVTDYLSYTECIGGIK